MREELSTKSLCACRRRRRGPCVLYKLTLHPLCLYTPVSTVMAQRQLDCEFDPIDLAAALASQIYPLVSRISSKKHRDQTISNLFKMTKASLNNLVSRDAILDSERDSAPFIDVSAGALAMLSKSVTVMK